MMSSLRYRYMHGNCSRKSGCRVPPGRRSPSMSLMVSLLSRRLACHNAGGERCPRPRAEAPR